MSVDLVELHSKGSEDSLKSLRVGVERNNPIAGLLSLRRGTNIPFSWENIRLLPQQPAPLHDTQQSFATIVLDPQAAQD